MHTTKAIYDQEDAFVEKIFRECAPGLKHLTKSDQIMSIVQPTRVHGVPIAQGVASLSHRTRNFA